MSNTETITREGIAVTAAILDLRNRSAYALANDADCASPDSPDSPGANMLTSVRDSVCDVLENLGAELLDLHERDAVRSINDDGTVDEIADGAPSVYTHPMWSQFLDLAAYNEDPTDLGADGEDMTKAAMVCLYIIAERLAWALIEEAAEEAADTFADLTDGEDD